MTAMTRREASDLMSVVKMRAKVTKTAVDALAAERQAEVERELSTIHKRDDALWAEIVAAICKREGYTEEFRPSIDATWRGRGENSLPARRAEPSFASGPTAASRRIRKWPINTSTPGRPIAARRS